MTNLSVKEASPKPDDVERQLLEGVGMANIPTLLLLLVQLTNDERWMSAPYLPTRSRGVDDNDTGGLPEDVQAEIRRAAYEAIVEHRRVGSPAPEVPSPSLVLRMMSVSEGVKIPEKYGALMSTRLKAFTVPEPAALPRELPDGFSALIVGSGMSGIGAALKFQEAGIPFEIVEKQDDIGGVWHSHFYPGCSVDTPSHLYSYTFEGGDWSAYFPRHDEIEAYFRNVAEKSGILEKVRFSTEVLSADYDEENHVWVSRLRNPDGSVEVHTSNLLISAVGSFAEPVTPRVDGLDSFEGTVVHTGRWDPDLDLAGKRVAVIGTGASAMQLVPAIAEQVSELTIFQRTRQWAAPFPKFRKPVPGPIRTLMREVPLYQHWYRLRLSWIFDSKAYPSLQKDPTWEDSDRSINAINAGHRRFFERYIREELGEHSELEESTIPPYPPYGKRMLLDNGWFRTITRPNVTLVDNAHDGIAHISAGAIHTRNGDVHEVDVIIFATGYSVSRMLSSLPIKGRDGLSVRDAWNDDDPQAFLGTVVPNFPNLFVLNGPNTQLGHGGAFIFIMECQTDYVLKIVDRMLEANLVEVECRRDVCEEYNETIQAKHQNMIWTHPGMTTYVRNGRGRVVVNNPWELVDFWNLLRQSGLDDYVVTEDPSVQRGVLQASVGELS